MTIRGWTIADAIMFSMVLRAFIGAIYILIGCLIKLYLMVGLHVLWFAPILWVQWVFLNSFR